MFDWVLFFQFYSFLFLMDLSLTLPTLLLQADDEVAGPQSTNQETQVQKSSDV